MIRQKMFQFKIHRIVNEKGKIAIKTIIFQFFNILLKFS